MSDEDLIEIENHNNLVSDVIFNRKMDVYVLLTEEADTKETEWIQCDNILNHEGFVLKYSLFGIKDTLKPINEYIAEIKESEQYKIFTSECRCNNCMTYFESDDDLLDAEDEDGEFKACPECNTDAYLMDLSDLK